MPKHLFRMTALALLGSASLAWAAQDLKPIVLPSAETNGGMPLMETLSNRRTTREFSDKDLNLREVSNLLWAGFGVNRPDTGHRTAPSAMNSQEVEIYVARAEGLYLYDALKHVLNPVLAEDVRPKTSGQVYIKEAPLVLIYVANLARLDKAKPETRPFYAGFDAGCICQNVYLFCASVGLGTVVFDLNRSLLERTMNLAPSQQIILAQAVGHLRN